MLDKTNSLKSQLKYLQDSPRLDVEDQSLLVEARLLFIKEAMLGSDRDRPKQIREATLC